MEKSFPFRGKKKYYYSRLRQGHDHGKRDEQRRGREEENRKLNDWTEERDYHPVKR